MPKKILIVDDDPDIVLFLSTVLQDRGYHTIDAPNGQEGLDPGGVFIFPGYCSAIRSMWRSFDICCDKCG